MAITKKDKHPKKTKLLNANINGIKAMGEGPLMRRMMKAKKRKERVLQYSKIYCKAATVKVLYHHLIILHHLPSHHILLK